MSDHIAFKTPGLCIITCSPFRNRFKTFSGILHWPQVVQTVPDIVHMPSCEEVWYHMQHCPKVKWPFSLTFCSNIDHHNQHRYVWVENLPRHCHSCSLLLPSPKWSEFLLLKWLAGTTPRLPFEELLCSEVNSSRSTFESRHQTLHSTLPQVHCFPLERQLSQQTYNT